MKPPSLMDKEFRYVPSGTTDIRKTFARIRREMAEAAKKQPANVRPMKKKEGK